MIEEKTFRQSYRASIVYPEIEKWMMTHQLRIKDFAELIDVSYNHTACICMVIMNQDCVLFEKF